MNIQSGIHIRSSSTLPRDQKMLHGRGSYQAKRLDWKRVQNRDKTDSGSCLDLYYMSASSSLRDFQVFSILSSDMGCAGCREKREVCSRKRINDFGIIVPSRRLVLDLLIRAFNHLWVCINNELQRQAYHFLRLPSNNHSTFVWPPACSTYSAWILRH